MLFDRVAQPSTKTRKTSDVKIFFAPSQGLIRNENMAKPKALGAEVMDNWFPTPEGARMFKGSQRKATIGIDLTTNGGFGADASWTKETNVTISAGAAHFTATPTLNSLYQAQALVAGTTYTIKYTVSGYSAGGITPFFSTGSFVSGALRTANGTYTEELTAVTGNAIFGFSTTGTTTLNIDNVSVVAGAAVTHLAAYEAGAVSKLFAADLTKIYDITSPADPAVPPAAAVSSLTSGQWSDVNFTTAGGSFLVMVNGADSMEQFDGSAWAAITAISAPISITGVATDDLSHIWKFKSRLFMIQGGTMSAWFLPTLSVGGAAEELPLGSIFSKGGSLLFGFTFSMDSGVGPDDYCGFCTDQGEVAVYQGTDPTDPFAWAIVGVYKIGRPLGKNAHFKAGGDIGILTDDGAISAIEMLQKDRAGLQKSAITYPIEPLWKETVGARFSGILPFSCVLWPAESMLVIGVPASGGQSRYSYAANTRHGAWARRTGWDIRCLLVYGDSLLFGTRDGTILEGDITGADEGEPYSAVIVPKFETFGRAEEKIANHCRMRARANNPFTPQLFACTNYEVDIPTPLSADADESANVWGVAIWGQFTWSSTADSKQARSSWQSVHGTGDALAPGIQITTGRVTAPDVELFALHLIYETGELIG